VSWHPAGQFGRIDRSVSTPILRAVAELSRMLDQPERREED
jgi:hypothetical protein